MKKFLSFLSLTTFLKISETFAQDAAAPAAAPNSFLLQLPIFIAIFGLFYFALIRPQKNQQKKHQEFLAKIARGEDVITSSGIIGKVVGLTPQVVTLEVSEGTEIKMLKSQIQGYLKESLPQQK